MWHALGHGDGHCEIMEYGPKGNMVVKFWVHGHKLSLSRHSLGATIIFYTHTALRQKKLLLDTGSPSRSQMLMAFFKLITPLVAAVAGEITTPLSLARITARPA